MAAGCMQALGTSPADLDADAAELGEGAVQALTNTVKAWHGRCDPSKLILLSQVLVLGLLPARECNVAVPWGMN